MLKRVLTVTLVAAGVLGFVSVVGNWTDALDAEFLVFGQTGGTGVTITKIIPQIAAGSFDGGATTFFTLIQVINAGTTPVSVTAEFFNQDGSPSTLPFIQASSAQDTDALPDTPSFTGSLTSFSLPANESLIMATGDTATGTINWGRIITDGSVTISAAFDLSGGGLISRVGVPASDSDITKLVMPRWRSTVVDTDHSTAFALVNTGDASITVTATLYSAAQIVASQTLTLAAGNQTAQFAKELFGLSNELGTKFTHMILESTAASLAATALVFEGNIQTSLAIGKLQ